jgi:hypothetical protein
MFFSHDGEKDIILTHLDILNPAHVLTTTISILKFKFKKKKKNEIIGFRKIVLKKKMEELIDRYVHARNKANDYTKHMEEYKSKIKALLKEETNQSFSRNGATASIKTLYKSTISKKNVPEDVWEKYSVTTPYEVLQVQKK